MRGGWLAWLPLCAAGCLLALGFGPKATAWSEVLRALTAYEPTREVDQVLLWVRLPRVLLGALVGAALATAGGVLQALTRNPLAGPELTGFNGGASLAVLLGLLWAPGMGLTGAMALAFAGGLGGMALVFALCAAGSDGPTPTRLALAGLVVSVTFGGISSGLVNYFQLTFEQLYWTLGGLNAVAWPQVAYAGVVMAVGFALTAPLVGPLDALRLGNEVATSVGVATRRVQGHALVAATLLTGAAVAVAGPVAFVGLMSPHVARALVGGRYLRLLPVSAALGALAVVWADTLARLYGQGVVPLGVFLGCLGSLLFLAFVARRPVLSHV